MSDIDNFLDGTTTKPVAPAGAQKQSSQIDDFLGDAPAPARGLKGWGQDIAASAVKGAIGVPEMLVGLADIPTGGRAGKFLANESGDFGFRPKEAKEIVNDWHSDATKEAQRKFGEAKGIWDKAKTAIENPSVIANSVGESLFLMGSGSLAARGLMALGARGVAGAAGGVGPALPGALARTVGAEAAPIAAGAIGEGVTMAGSAAEQIRQETKDGLLTPTQSGLALATGGVGAAFGYAGGKLAHKFGFGDADTMLAQGARGVAREAEESAAARTGAAALQRTALSNIPKKVIQGAISEGFFEELPQSVAEQIFQNMALDKPWDTDLDSASVMGVLSGAAMGGPASGVHAYGQYRNGNAPQPPGQQQGQPPGTQPNNSAPPVNPGLERVRQAFLEQLQALQAQEQGEPTVPQVEPPNGAAILAQRQAENRAITSPDDEIYQSTGYNEYAQRQSEIANQPPELNPSLERARQGLTNQLEHLQTQEQGEPTVPQAAPPDGAAVLARQQAQQQAARDAVNQVNRAVTSPDDEIYQSTGRGFTPSQRMGINPKAGPLSAGAAIALDTGVSTPIQQAAAMPTSLRAQSGDEAGSVWSQMPTAQRMELAQRVDLKPIIKNNLHSAQWEGINPEIQSKLAQAMQTQGGLAQSQSIPDAPLTRAPDIATGPARVLQNRDRSTAASIGQMNDIASAPDYLRAGQARVMDSGAPVVFGAAPTSALMGKQQQIADGHGARVPVQYAVVEAADVLPSHQADGTPIAQYQQGVPGQLRAVAGNGRAAGITEAYRRGTTTQYRQDLIDDAPDLGVDPEAISAMSAPMLVRVMPEEHVTDDMGDRSNISGTAALSATEQANNDTKRLDLSALSFDEAGTPDRQSIAQFVNAMPVGERGAMMQPDGSPTRQAIDRITGAAFKSAYGNDELVALQAQSIDPEIRNIITALANVAGPMAGLEGAGDLDIRGAVSEAAQMAVNAKRLGVPLADYLNNADMGFSGEAFVVAKFMADNIRSAKRMAEGLRAWVNYVAEQVAIARDNQSQDGFFGATPTASRNDVFNQLGANNEQANTSNAPLQNGASGPSRVTSSPQRQEAQPVAEPSRPADFEENNAQEVGSFGPILTQFKGDAQGAIKALTELQSGEAVAALSHPEVGDIDLVWGESGTKEKKYEDGHGLAKISIKHPEVLADLQGFLLRLHKDNEQSGKNRIRLVDDEGTAVVRLQWNGNQKIWLLTAFENDVSPAADGGRTGVPNSAESATPAEQGAGSGQSLAQPATKGKQTAVVAKPESKFSSDGVGPSAAEKELQAQAQQSSIDDVAQAKRKHQNSIQIAKQLNLTAGDEIGTLVFNDTKVATGVTITITSETGLSFGITGKRGVSVMRGTVGADAIKAAIDRAFENGKRKDSYEQFIAARNEPVNSASAGLSDGTILATPSNASDVSVMPSGDGSKSITPPLTPKAQATKDKAQSLGIALKHANGKSKALPILAAEIKAKEAALAAQAAQPEGLTSPTAEEVVAQQDQAEAAAKAETAQRRAQDERDRLERIRKDIAKASIAAADEFVLGGDAEQNLSGQRDIFGEASTTPEAAKPQVKANTIFTEDAAAAARARLKAKLGRLNSGIDPEMLMDGITLAGYHIEQGARTFAAYAKAMVSDLGEGVKPYLKSWYMGVKYDPRASGFSGMDSADSVDSFDVESLNEIANNELTQPNNGQKGELNVPSADSRVERDSQEPSTEPAVGDVVPVELRGADAAVAQAGGRPHRGAGSGQQDGAGVPFGSAPVAGERGDQRLHPNDQPAELASIVTGADFGESGGDSGVAGVPAEPIAASQVDAVAQPRPQGLKDIIERNKANKAPVELGDIDSIRATLPQLLTGQQDDVKLAEDRFAKPDGYGMLFTNGTGTGKTFSGLGIIKRFSLQGKTNTLIAVPDSKIASDWIESGKRLGLGLSLLKDTKDAGSGIVITTYANLGENDQLARRSWDLVVADEAHTLMQAADGAPTSYLHNLRAITNHPDGAGTRHTMLNRDAIERAAALEQEIADTARDISGADTTVMRRNALEVKNEKLQLELSALRQKLNAEQSKVSDAVKAAQGAGRTRLVALSATPFAYEKTIDWANGYLFDYNDGQASDKNEFRGYNSGSNKDRYMMRHFGYSMSTNRLMRPDAKVDTGLMQRQWNTSLKKSGALSGRMLDVAPDYDRRFILVESAIGNRIDEALEWLNAQRQAEKGSRHFADLSDIINDQFKFLQKRYLLEAIKATEVIPIVKAHMAMGRKVVVFHDYKKGGGFNPFHVRVQDSDMRPAFESFKAQFGDLINAPLGSMPSPIEVFKRELPQTLLINGDEKKADLLDRYKSFQDDANGPQVMLVQSNKNKGWSGHDTTGKHQRVLINLGQPTAPTLAIQQEGRIYRTGQASDAIMRYMNTGTNWERWTFATTIATRASTAENLGMGEMARALKDSFIQSFEESDTYAPGHEGEGKGGKERDKAANDALTEFDRAKSHYWATQKKNSRTKAQEGTDYFATPEPLGLKMAQWLDARISEDVIEPSAGHGAIARWIPDNTSRTVIEPSLALRSRLSMVMNPLEDRIIGGSFEEHHVSNKYDGIVMNPPFGTGGRMAVDHLAKAATHLRDGGRIVALIPTGPAADKAFEKWFYEASEKPVKPLMLHPTLGPIYKGDTVYVPGYEQTTFKAFGKKGELLEIRAPGYGTTETIDRIVKVEPTGPRSESVKPAEGLQLVANIKLPQVTFERAGTAVSTRVVVIEKSDRDIAQSVRDLSSITEINELFDRLENLDFAGRTKPVEPIEAKAGKAAKADDKPAKVVASVGDEVTIGGKAYPVEIYTTSAGKEKRGVWMDSKAEASKYSARTFTTSSNKGKWFVDEYWFPKDSEISKPDAAFSRKDELGSGSTVNWTDSKDQSHAAKVAVAIEKAEPGKPAYDYTIVEPQGSGKSRGNRTQAGAKNISDALDERVRGFERAFGRTVIFVRANGASPSFFNGFILPKSDPNTIYVNADASVNLMSVLGHEFYEGIAAKSPTLHAWFVTEAVKQLEKGALTKYSSRLAAAGDTQDIAGRFKELLADFTGDALADPLFRQSLNDANPSRFKVLIRALMAYLQKVLNRLTNTPVAGGLTGGKDLGSSEYFKDIQTLRAVLKDVIKQADSGGNLASFLSSNAMFSRKQIVGETTRQHTPEQLRAMANVGFQVEVPTLQERAKALWADAGKKLTQGIVDQFSPVKDISKDAYRLLRMSKGASGAFEAMMHGGRLKLTDGVYDIDRAQRGGVVEKLFKPMQGEHHDFLRWVAANRAERLLGDGREHLFTQADIDALKTLADGTLNHAYTLKNGARAGQTTTDRNEMYRDSLVTFNEFNTNALDMAEQSGLINADGRKDWESEFYVPFYRAMQEDGSGVVGGNIKSGVVRQSAFKHLKGGKDKLNADLLDNTLMNWAHLLDAGAKNRAALATLEAAQNMGVAIEASADVARDIGRATHNRNGVVWAMDEGVQRYFVVDDPYILTALTSLEYAGMRNPVMNAMGTMKRVLTIGVTASPFFKIRNLIRDSVQAIGLGDMSYNIGSNLKEGWKLTDPKSDAYFSLLASGGTIHFGSMYEGNESQRIQALVESGVDRDTILNDPYRVKEFYRKTLEPLVTAYNEVGNRGEAINRAALYDHLVKKGVSHAEAALQARDLMDFSMQGAFTSIRFLTQVVPFMNARLQGLYKLGKSAKQNPQRFATVLGAVAAVSLALLAAYGDDDDWKRRTESDRNNFWWFKIGGKAFVIPKPFEIGAIATLAERSFELAFDKEMTNKRFRTQLLKLLGDNLSMNPVPQLVKPMLDVYSNIDGFTDRPIESMGMERLKSEYRYSDRTSMTARGLSTAMNSATGLLGKESLSPVQIDHMLRGYFGWLGSFVVGTADLLARPATGQVDQASRDLWKTATGNIASDLRDAPSRYVSQMYEQAKEIERAYGTWRELQKQGKTQEAQEFRSEHLKELNQYHHVEAVKRQEALFNQQSRRIERSDMQPDMKRERLRAIGEQKHKLAKSLV